MTAISQTVGLAAAQALQRQSAQALRPEAPASEPGPVLTDAHRQQLAVAARGVKQLRRVTAVATFSGWTIAAFAAMTTLLSLMSPSGLALAAGMGVIAYVELQGAARLRRLDASALRTLACNQLAFGGLIVAYALWQFVATLLGPGPYAQYMQTDPQVAQMLASVEQLVTALTLSIYACMVPLAVVFQGGTAWYYHSRIKPVRAYLDRTPPWVLDLQRSGVI